MAGIIVAAKVWRWTPWERYNQTLGGDEEYMQIGGLAPSFRGVRLNPYTDGTVALSARDGRTLKGQGSQTYPHPSRNSTIEGGMGSSESAFMLTDVSGNLSENATKWNQSWVGFKQTGGDRRFLEWEWPRPVKADGVWLSTANDCATYLGRRPVSWNLDAFLPGRGWHRVYSARKVSPPTTNTTWYGPFEFQRIIPVDGVKGP